MQMKLGIVARLGSKLPAIVDDMIRRCVDQKRHESAHFLLSTAHKVKGLEYPSVLLWHDFVDVSGVARRGARYVAERNDGFGESVWEEVDSDEINLLYVAATRARRELFLPRSAAQVHGGFPPPEGSRRATHNLGHDARTTRSGRPGVPSHPRARGPRRFRNPSPGGETPSGKGSAKVPARARRRARGADAVGREPRASVGLNPSAPRAARGAARPRARRAHEVAKFAPEGAGSGAGTRDARAWPRPALAARATAWARRPADALPGFTCAADRDFHAAATGAVATTRTSRARATARVPPAARPPRRRRAPGARHPPRARGRGAGRARRTGRARRGAEARREGDAARPAAAELDAETRSRRSPRRRARRRGGSRDVRGGGARARLEARGRAGRRRRRGRRGRRVFVSRRVSPLFDFYQVPFRELSC